MDVSVVEVASGVWQARARHVCWVLITDGDGVTLVDTGYPGDKARVIASLGKIGRAPADVDAVVLTHAHPDHIGSAEYFRSQVGKPVWVHEQEKPNATGEHVEQVSVPTLLKMAWRPSVFVWFVQAGIGLKAAQVQRLGAVETLSGGGLDVPGHPLPVHTPVWSMSPGAGRWPRTRRPAGVSPTGCTTWASTPCTPTWTLPTGFGSLTSSPASTRMSSCWGRRVTNVIPVGLYKQQLDCLTAARSLTYRLLTDAEHAGNRCNAGYTQLAPDTIIDWITLVTSHPTSKP